MDSLLERLARLKSETFVTDAVHAVASVFGGTRLADGVIRIFPVDGELGYKHWNQPEFWRGHWHGISPELVFFAEDCFGNQFGTMRSHPSVLLWCHEDGKTIDVELSPYDFLDALVTHGADWMDFYQNGSPAAYRESGNEVGWNEHLHWVKLLILGGSAVAANIARMGRILHLRGHAQIWAQLQGMNPGDEIIFRQQDV